MTKYIFITGGVVSSLGKGVAAAACGALLQSRGFTVHARKLDPYLNIDTGTMSPLQHGEVYVTADGHETDLDLGYYERFLGIKLSYNDSVSGGRIYWDVLNAQIRGEYKGATIQMIPHITNKIKEYISNDPGTDFVIYEIGGTVGDIEGQLFLESIRQFANDVGRKNVMFVHLTLAPYLEKSGELKTKPTQMSVRNLLEHGIQSDMLIVRTPRMLDDSERKKIGMFCNLSPDNIVSGLDVNNIYEIPLSYEKQNVFDIMAEHFGLEKKQGDLSKFERIENYLSTKKQEITIGIVGKYFDTLDSYKSLLEALFHAGIQNNVKLNIKKIDAEKDFQENLTSLKGILVPAGFGNRGFEGKLQAVKYARENNIPFLGIGLGMQAAVIEFVQNVSGKKHAGSQEFSKNKSDVFIKYDDDKMNLGAKEIFIQDKTNASKIYNEKSVLERHRNRYKFNKAFEKDLIDNGMIISGTTKDGLAEIVEIKDHKFFMGAIFHPEFQSSPYSGHPLFNAFIKSILD